MALGGGFGRIDWLRDGSAAESANLETHQRSVARDSHRTRKSMFVFARHSRLAATTKGALRDRAHFGTAACGLTGADCRSRPRNNIASLTLSWLPGVARVDLPPIFGSLAPRPIPSGKAQRPARHVDMVDADSWPRRVRQL